MGIDNPESEPLDVRRVRALLAAHRVTQKTLARAAGLHPGSVSHVLTGQLPAGELFCFKIARGLHRLGLDREEEAEGVAKSA